MFYHGIKWEYVWRQYPILSPRRSVGEKKKEQRQDRLHLLQQFGVEPIHLLEAGDDYPADRCLRECSVFGDTVFEFDRLRLPVWQLSPHEIGVEVLDLRTCTRIYVTGNPTNVADLFPGIPCIHYQLPRKFT